MERIISAERVEDILNVFGSFDQNLHIIEKEWNVCVTDRDAELKISGELLWRRTLNLERYNMFTSQQY